MQNQQPYRMHALRDEKIVLLKRWENTVATHPKYYHLYNPGPDG